MSVAINILGMRSAASSLFLAGSLTLTALGLASCSANVSRFDYPMFAAASDEQNASLTTASVSPVPDEPVYQSVSQQSFGEQTVVKRELPPPSSYQPPPVAYQPAPTRLAAAPPLRPEPMPLPRKRAPAPQPEPVKVTVKRGDTLSAIARRHDVSVQQIVTANNLKNTRLSLGQQLAIPGGKMPAARPLSAGTYKVQRGDSLSAIARKNNVELRLLASQNGLRQDAMLQPGQVLKIPDRNPPAAVVPIRVASRGPTVPVPTINPVRRRQPAAAGVRPAAKPRKQTAVSKPLLPAPKPMTGNRFRWPVRGRIISGFGSKPNGKQNDGINVAVPLGTSVKSAENGVVAYAGSELQGFGNLVLIRHSNDWVSAYAHNDEILVKRGDEVRRGQVIGKAGKSGSVSQPQVHFELRKGSKPVDPLKYMASG